MCVCNKFYGCWKIKKNIIIQKFIKLGEANTHLE